MSKKKKLNFQQVIKEEDAHLKARRKYRNGDAEATQLDDTRFGIAMSGGGIRSATINLGILKTLNKFGILEKADYLSTVSGGGYTGAYVQSLLKKRAAELKNNPQEAYKDLFHPEHIDYLRDRGEYMMPGVGKGKIWNTFILVIGYLVSTLMSWVSPLIFIFLSLTLLSGIGKVRGLVGDYDFQKEVYKFIENYWIVEIGIGLFFLTYVVHFFYNLKLKYDLGISRKFNHAEGVFAAVAIIAWGFLILLKIGSLDVVFYEKLPGILNVNIGKTEIILLHLVAAIIAIALGYFANPNAISFHRFYRNQLADAYLHFGAQYKNVELSNLIQQNDNTPENLVAPYPLINTCLNLQFLGGGDENFKGAKASDYFLLSPFYFGSKITGYVDTETFRDYRELTLPAATTISAAAVNPGMGTYSNKLLSVLMTTFNVRLGFWISNPLKRNESERVWWPWYFFKELFSKIGTANRKLNISDGGHIENLGVYELLRRRCRLILSVDAGADPLYSFEDLEILTVRARNELGLSIEFREGHIPEDVIRPKPSYGYSLERFAIADVYHLWDEIMALDAAGNPVKDENYRSFEVLVNYPDLKDAIKLLDYNGKLLVRIIFRVINEFKEVNELRNQLEGLDAGNTEVVVALLNTMIFCNGDKAHNRTAGIKAVLAHAIENEPEKIKSILKEAGLLSTRFKDKVRLPKRIIKHLVDDRLDEGIGAIEQVIIKRMTKSEIKNAYKVMETFLTLLSQIEVGVDQKLVNAYLLRKIEDAFFMKIMEQRGMPQQELSVILEEEPEDQILKDFLVDKNIAADIVQELFEQRDILRAQVRKLSIGETLSAEDGLAFKINEFEPLATVLLKFNELLNEEHLDPETLIAQLEDALSMVDLSPALATRILQLKKQQLPKVTEVMQVVSQRIEEQVRNDIKASTLIYIKSSVKAPKGKIVTDDETMYGAYKYKIYHPDFPHESTADQFFDPVQWEAYYMLGQYLGAEVLDVKGLNEYFNNRKLAPDFSIKDLLYRFDHDQEVKDLFLYRSDVSMPAVPIEMDEIPPLESERISSPRLIVPSNDPEEELLNQVNQPNMKKKVVAGKNIDYTI